MEYIAHGIARLYTESVGQVSWAAQVHNPQRAAASWAACSSSLDLKDRTQGLTVQKKMSIN